MVKAEAAKVAFTTKSGQTVSFGGGKGGGKSKKIKALELRLKVIEKSFALAEKEKQKAQLKAAKQAEKDALRNAKVAQSKVVPGGKLGDKKSVGKKTAATKSKKATRDSEDD